MITNQYKHFSMNNGNMETRLIRVFACDNCGVKETMIIDIENCIDNFEYPKGWNRCVCQNCKGNK